MNNYPIDFIVTWVDGNDPVWRAEKEKYQGVAAGTDSRNRRYRDWELLRYWFRAIEQNAPWVNKIYFVTYGHLPEWINLDNPKLVIINHHDYIPEKYLPTFSSRPIDMNFHRIDSLSEHFVYFNDDMFILEATTPEDFFHNGLPKDMSIEEPQFDKGVDQNGESVSSKSIYTASFYNTAVINRHFNKRKVIRENRGKWYSLKYGKWLINNILLSRWPFFVGFRNSHMPYSYLKSTYSKVWNLEEEVLDSACVHKFRTSTDVNHVLFSFWQLAEGKYFPREDKLGTILSIRNDESRNEEVYETIRNHKFKLLCINDQYSGENFEIVKGNLQSSFEILYPKKSSFEK